jgi:hypothetical protein
LPQSTQRPVTRTKRTPVLGPTPKSDTEAGVVAALQRVRADNKASEYLRMRAGEVMSYLAD